MRFFSKLLFVLTLAAPASLLAQDAAPSTDPVQIKAFEKAERMSDLRHKHLWLAYGAAWLIIGAFVWRTHSMSKQTDAELTALKRKIERLEGQQNG